MAAAAAANAEPLVNNFQVPKWAGKPPTGLHLDVIKDGKLIQKLMVDEKRCYFFGRNKQLCDFRIEHSSCSRVHAALVWHKHLTRPFLIDLGSVHGTFIGHIRMESEKPQQIPMDSEIRFGASTRVFIIRERPQTAGIGLLGAVKGKLSGSDETSGGGDGGESLFGLPETESELDNLTEFNTAHNRRVPIVPDAPRRSRSQKSEGGANPSTLQHSFEQISYADEDEVINPEDVDPSIGRFRNLVQTTVIPSKRIRLSAVGIQQSLAGAPSVHHQPAHGVGDWPDDLTGGGGGGGSVTGTFSVATKFGLAVPNLAPSLDPMDRLTATSGAGGISAPRGPNSGVVERTRTQRGADEAAAASNAADEAQPKKKVYAKEAWPGKKPGAGPSLQHPFLV